MIFDYHALNTKATSNSACHRHLQQSLYWFGQRAETVFEFFAVIGKFGVGVERVYLPVTQHTFATSRNILFRQIERKIAVNAAILDEEFALQRHGLLGFFFIKVSKLLCLKLVDGH